MNYAVLAYYFIGKVEDPHSEVARHKEFFQGKDFRGRIYISEQGINGQASASESAAHEYITWMKEDLRFREIPFKIHASHEHVFPKMTVKYRRQLVAIDCEVDFSKRGEYVEPAQWRKMLEEREETTLLLDVRNDYEWEVGHFEGAKLPPLEAFRKFPLYAKELKASHDPQNTRIMMYCTGGIRCEFYSAVLKKEGFENVYQLEGGVIEYGLREGSEFWKGKLFVFDDRLVVPLSDELAAPISHCKHCKAPCDFYYNCAQIDCNDLFLCCPKCLKELRGCCSSSCLQRGHVRPYQESAKPFRKWDYREKLAWREGQRKT